MNAVLKFRPVEADDEPFLKTLRAEFDSERLFLTHWEEKGQPFRQHILDLQYKAHASHYQYVKTHWDTRDNIIEFDGKPVGRFIVWGDSHEIRLADIIVGKTYRGFGIGQAVLDTTKAECMQSKRRLTLHVDKYNDTVSFYARQGFYSVEETPTHVLMEWKPGNMPGKPVYFYSRSKST